MSKFRFHIFACQNLRAQGSRPSCAGRGSAAVLRALQQRLLDAPDLCEQAAITPCGCLGTCFDGPMLVVYPDGVWYRAVTAADVDDIVDSHLRRGVPVARLRYDWGA